MGVCERCDSMGVKERRERTAVNSRPFGCALGQQFKVERAKIVRAKRRDTECAESSGARRDARGGEGASSRMGRGSGVEGHVHGVCYRNP